MVLWSERISNEDLFEVLPSPCFPDVEELELRIGEKALHITGRDSEWSLQSDITLAAGPGCMSFFYEGELRFAIDDASATRSISMAEAQAHGLPVPQDIQLIKRGEPWEFLFSCKEGKKLRIFANVVNISWTPEEE